MGFTVWPDGVTGDVVREVYEERGRQERLRESGKFEWTLADPKQSNARKLAVLAEEFGEVSREVTEEIIIQDQGTAQGRLMVTREKLRAELIQVAACAVAWAEALEKRQR